MNRSYLLPPRQFQREFRPHQEQESTRRAAAASGPTVSAYLNARLKQIGVTHVMAIPGDYVADWVEALDDPAQNPAPALVRVHPNNEMCASYAADGYSRVTGGAGVGCVAFTYGVGALNAVQAVAGAAVESVAMVAINGSPSPAQFHSQRDQGVLWHHMFDGTHTDLRIFSEITEMAVRIDNPAYAADLIDAALIACITASKPVYIEMAITTQSQIVDGGEERLKKPLKAAPIPRPAEDPAFQEAIDLVWQALVDAKRLVLLGGVEIARFGLQEKFTRLNQALKAPYLSSLLGKGILSEYTAPNFSGTYNGMNSQKNVQTLIQQADVILALGVHETDFNFSGVTSPDFEKYPGLPVNFAIEARLGAVRINSGVSDDPVGELYWGDITLEELIDALNAKLEKEGPLPNSDHYPRLQGEVWDIPAPSTYGAGDQITWDSFKSLLQHEYLDTFDEEQDQDTPVVLADTGLTFYSLNNIKVPANGYIAQLAWGAIGYSPAASYGVKLGLDATGQGKRRVLSVSGDGAFSETANAIGTIAELGLDNVVFVMANGVFAIEQFLINSTGLRQGSADQVRGVDAGPADLVVGLGQAGRGLRRCGL